MERPEISKATGAHQSSTFPYRFSYISRTQPDATVLIFIPGGPGQTSMDMGLSLPDSFAVVRTDPRGVGCNKVPLPEEALTSEELARDILAIVKEIKPKRYILHGISYGTVVATMAASLAEEEGVPRPAAVVLEGTMGKVFEPDEYLEGYLAKWKELQKVLPRNILEQFRGPAFPLGYSSKEWAAWISSMSIYGASLDGESLLHENLMLLDPALSEESRDVLNAQVKRAKTLPTPEKIHLYRQIICRELVPDIRDIKYDFDFKEGEMVAIPERFCEGTPLSRPYDSARYQIKVPVYYFVGDQDPATPLSQAQYHFAQQQGPKVLTRVANGGHQTLSFNLMDCAHDLWKAIDENSKTSFEAALGQCALKEHVRSLHSP